MNTTNPPRAQRFTAEQLRSMTSAELAELRTDCSMRVNEIDAALLYSDERGDRHWESRAKYALQLTRATLGGIKAIQAERNREANNTLHSLGIRSPQVKALIDAATALVDDDSDGNWERLEAALADACETIARLDALTA